MTELEKKIEGFLSDFSGGPEDTAMIGDLQEIVSLAKQEQAEVDAKIAENPGCMTSGQSPLDEWCRKCAAAIRAKAGQSSPVKESGECPMCKGEGRVIDPWGDEPDDMCKCYRCKGTGKGGSN